MDDSCSPSALGFSSPVPRQELETSIEISSPILLESAVREVASIIGLELNGSLAEGWGWSVKPSIGASGGIITCWDESLFSLEAEWIGSHSVVTVLSNKLHGFHWLLINVYGPCIHSLKLQFLNELKDIVSWWPLPVCVAGDFNLIRSPSQVVGGNRSNTEMQWFNDWINELMLVDLPLRGACLVKPTGKAFLIQD
ncbi:hypothetical protein LINPERHAP1_LOCUS18818 [Linum perenne]